MWLLLALLLVPTPAASDQVLEQALDQGCQVSSADDPLPNGRLMPETGRLRINVTVSCGGGGCAGEVEFIVTKTPEHGDAWFEPPKARQTGGGPLGGGNASSWFTLTLNRNATAFTEHAFGTEIRMVAPSGTCNAPSAKVTGSVKADFLLDVKPTVRGGRTGGNGIEWAIEFQNLGNGPTKVAVSPGAEAIHWPEEKWDVGEPIHLQTRIEGKPTVWMVEHSVSVQSSSPRSNYSVELSVGWDGSFPDSKKYSQTVHLPLPLLAFEGSSTPGWTASHVVAILAGLALSLRRSKRVP